MNQPEVSDRASELEPAARVLDGHLETPLSAAHLLGRQPSDDELAAAKASKNPIGLLLASPSFQWS